MVAPVNVLQAVKTVQQKGLMMVQNFGPVFNRADKRFNNFQTFSGQLGDSVSYIKQARATVVSGTLVQSPQSAVQRIQNLTVNQAFNASEQYTSQQLIFNVDPLNWEKSWIKSAIVSIASNLEAYVSNDFTIYPYRYYGDGNTPINTNLELNTILMRFRNFGSVDLEAQFFLPDFSIPSINNNMLNQFAVDRNNKTANSWEIGKAGMCNFMSSNKLQRHIAGSEGQASGSGAVLTIVSTTKDAAGQITAITFSGTQSSTDANSIKKGDRFTVSPSSGASLLQFVGYGYSVNPIQFMAASDAAASGGQVTVTLSTPLYPGQSLSDAISISTDLTAGMTVSVANSHVAACIYAGAAHQVANPALPDQSPFETGWQTDPQTGASIRVTYSSNPNDGTSRVGLDTIVGSTMDPDLCMTVCFPLNQGS